MAPTGFEPATPGLKVQCSTKLSYGAMLLTIFSLEPKSMDSEEPLNNLKEINL